MLCAKHNGDWICKESTVLSGERTILLLSILMAVLQRPVAH